MKYLGIDYGKKRVGVAVSDEEGRLAFPRSVLKNEKNLFSELEKITNEEKIGAIVIGESKNYQGEPNVIMAEIEKFKKALEQRTNLPVFFEPEYLTSSQAKRVQGETEMHDASAAAIILQSHLDKINSKRSAE